MRLPDMSLGDRVAFAINPARAARRIIARVKMREALKLEASLDNGSDVRQQRSETRWRGASQTLRSLSGWLPTLGSGRSDTPKAERERLSARGWDAYRNHLIARAAVTRVRTNVVGTGLTMHPDVDGEALGVSDDEAEKLKTNIRAEWALYYENPAEVDIEATSDGYGLQALALISAMISGDCFALTPMVETPNGMYELKVQLVDAARVSNQNGQPDTKNLLDGIEVSDLGRPQRVHIRNRHPADRYLGAGLDAWSKVDIFDDVGRRRVLQILNDKDRLGSTRGVSYLAPILEPLQTLEQYTRAELLATVVSAMFTVFIKKTEEHIDERGNPVPAIAGQTVKGAASDLALGPGAILDLAPNEEAQTANPGRPNSNYDPFFLAIVRQIGAALEIPLDELLLNYQASYSAARAAMLQAWRFYSMRRWWLVQQFCQPHYQLWFDEAVARGKIVVSDYADPRRRAAYTKAIWIGPARGAMQERDEIMASRARIDAGLSNETIETAQLMGEYWPTIYKQRKREIEIRRQDGTELTPAPGGPGTGAPGAQPAPGPARKTGESVDETAQRGQKQAQNPAPGQGPAQEDG